MVAVNGKFHSTKSRLGTYAISRGSTSKEVALPIFAFEGQLAQRSLKTLYLQFVRAAGRC